MVESALTPDRLYLINGYAEALNTLAAALSSLISDEIVTIAEARGILSNVLYLPETVHDQTEHHSTDA